MYEIMDLIREKWQNANLFSAPQRGQRIFIYGAGQLGNDVHRALTKMGYAVHGFIDKRANIIQVKNGIPVFLPDDERLSLVERQESVIFVAIHNRNADVSKICKKLILSGFQNLLTPVFFYDFLSEQLGERFWLTHRNFYLDNQDHLRQAYSLFSDETSRKEFLSQVSLRINGDYAGLSDPDLKNQYFHHDLAPIPSPVRFVDCGAYNGDTIKRLIEITDNIEEIVAFEPDSKNFFELANLCREQSHHNIKLWPCAAFSKNELIHFSGEGESGNINPLGNITIQGVALDDALPNFQPTYIKMDIEGSEIDALWGAKAMISKWRPRLGISLYYRPTHLWEIPLLVADWNLDYDFAIRPHGFNGFDLVFYAIPN